MRWERRTNRPKCNGQYQNREDANRKIADERLRKWHKCLAVGIVVCMCVMSAVILNLYGQRKAVEKRISQREAGEDAFPNTIKNGTVEYHGKTYRRSSNVKAILCIGVDRRGKMAQAVSHTMGGQADGIFVIAQDTARNTMRFLIVPRDIMTEITMTDLSGNILGKDIQHLNLAYAYGDGRELSCERVMEALSGAFCGFAFDHYLAANMDVINKLNNYVGGVTVTVPAGMENRDPAFVEGERITLKGEQAEAFVRYRDTGEEHSAIYRLDRQEEFLIHFLEAVKEKSKKNSEIVEGLLEEIEEYMVTDMTREEYLKMAMSAVNVDKIAEKDFYIVPGQSVVGEVYNEFYVDRESLIPVLLELFYREI